MSCCLLFCHPPYIADHTTQKRYVTNFHTTPTSQPTICWPPHSLFSTYPSRLHGVSVHTIRAFCEIAQSGPQRRISWGSERRCLEGKRDQHIYVEDFMSSYWISVHSNFSILCLMDEIKLSSDDFIIHRESMFGQTRLDRNKPKVPQHSTRG